MRSEYRPQRWRLPDTSYQSHLPFWQLHDIRSLIRIEQPGDNRTDPLGRLFHRIGGEVGVTVGRGGFFSLELPRNRCDKIRNIFFPAIWRFP